MDSRIYVFECNKCYESNNNFVSKIKEFDSNINKTKKSLSTEEKVVKDLVTPLSKKIHDSEVDYNWRWNDRTDPNDPNGHIIGTNTYTTLKLQKEVEKRNQNLQKAGIKKLCQHSQNEFEYLWKSDKSRQNEIFDSGEIDELNNEYEKIAVRRFGHVLLRVSTGKPVACDNIQNKWIDIEVSDEKELGKLRQLIQCDEEKELY